MFLVRFLSESCWEHISFNINDYEHENLNHNAYTIGRSVYSRDMEEDTQRDSLFREEAIVDSILSRRYLYLEKYLERARERKSSLR